MNTAEGGPSSGHLTGWLSPTLVILSFFFSHVFLVMIVTQRARAAVRLLDMPTTNGAAVAARMDHVFTYARWGTLAITAFHLYALQVPDIVQGWLATTVLLKHIPLLPEAIYLTPAFLAWVGLWIANYQIELTMRERSFPYRLAMGLPAHEMPPLGHYLSMQMRHNFYLILLVGISSLIEDLGEKLDPYWPHASDVGTPVAILVVLALVPWLITRVWSTVPLKGPLRHRLDRLAGHYRLRFRNILIWKTHNHVTNAAILGWVPFSRYFLMTDALLETLTDQQIEAVFAHEVGHGVHKHILWYLVAIVGAWALCFGLGSLGQFYLPAAMTEHLTAWTGHSEATGALCVMALMTVFFAFGFSFFSHRFEHQADWFAARHMGKFIASHPGSEAIAASALAVEGDALPQTLMEVSAVEKMTLDEYIAGSYPNASTTLSASAVAPPLAQAATSPAMAGVEVFISSLDTIMELSHRSRNRRGWMHPSMNNRVSLLRRLAANTEAAAEFNRRMLTTRLIIALLLVSGAASLYWASKLPEPAKGVPAGSAPLSPADSGKTMII